MARKQVSMNILSQSLKVATGFSTFYRTGIVPDEDFHAWRSLHCRTNGFATDVVNRFIALRTRKPRVDTVSGLAGVLSPERRRLIVDILNRDGVYVFAERINPCFVRGTHRRDAEGVELRARGPVRIPDEDIVSTYGKERVLEICRQRGTLIALDTRAFHKGVKPMHTDRLIFELNYANSTYTLGYKNSTSQIRLIDSLLSRNVIPRCLRVTRSTGPGSRQPE
jgi:hypothetical protein